MFVNKPPIEARLTEHVRFFLARYSTVESVGFIERQQKNERLKGFAYRARIRRGRFISIRNSHGLLKSRFLEEVCASFSSGDPE